MNNEQGTEITAEGLLPLALDLWRLHRATQDESPLSALVTRAFGRLESLGLRLETLEGSAFDENARVRVVEHRPGPETRTIIECVTPAIYWRDRLLKEANVITKGQP